MCSRGLGSAVSLKFWTKLHVLLPTSHLNIDLLRKRADLKVDATESRKSTCNRRKELNPYPPYPDGIWKLEVGDFPRLRNTRVKKEMNDWLAIYRRQNVSVGRRGGKDWKGISVVRHTCGHKMHTVLCQKLGTVNLKSGMICIRSRMEGREWMYKCAATGDDTGPFEGQLMKTLKVFDNVNPGLINHWAVFGDSGTPQINQPGFIDLGLEPPTQLPGEPSQTHWDPAKNQLSSGSGLVDAADIYLIFMLSQFLFASQFVFPSPLMVNSSQICGFLQILA